MWKRKIQRTSFCLFTIPVYIGILIVRLSSYQSILRDYKLCISVVRALEGRFSSEVSQELILTLVLAEDHRNSLHYGVDPIAVVRALFLRVFYGKKQGASTIEQQLVRTIVERYEKTPRRKIREQILAVMLSSCFEKAELAATYLKVAYYGGSLVGGKGLQRLRSENSGISNEVIVSYLKYPRSLVYSERLQSKHLARVVHIKRLLSGEIKLLFYMP